MGFVRIAAAGAVAGAVATVAMDRLWYGRYRADGGTEPFGHWEAAEDVTGWDNASSPGQVGKRVAELVLGHTPPDSWARTATNGVHWATGIGWGVAYAIARQVAPSSRVLPLALGPAAWLTSYAVLPVLKVYKPIWKYDAPTLRKDFSAHLVFGVVAATVFAVVGRRR